MAPAPLPGGFRLRFGREVRRPVPGVLLGGAPLRVLRLTGAGSALVDRWMSGGRVGDSRAAATLAARLVDSGLAVPEPPDGPLPPVAVVVPVRDDQAGLAATLDALGTTAAGVPVVVVDDGSRPPVDAAGRGPGVVVLRREEAGGPASARNTGMRAVPPATEVAVFVDAGCVPHGRWLARLLAHFSDPAVAAAAPRVSSRVLAGTPPSLAAYEAVRSPLDLGGEPAPVRPGSVVPYVPTAVLAVRSSAFRALGGFDETMRFGEDVDFVWRLDRAGWRIRYEPAAGATHPARTGRRRWLRQRFDYGRSATPLAVRHGRAVAPLAVSPWSVAVWCLLAWGRPVSAAALTLGSAEALARRAGGDRALAAELRRLAVLGTLRAGGPIAAAIRRAWLPPVLLVTTVAWSASGRRARRWLLAATGAVLVGPGLSQWWPRRSCPGLPGPISSAAWRLADDLAYQAGVWDGAVRGRSVAALLPRW